AGVRIVFTLQVGFVVAASCAVLWRSGGTIVAFACTRIRIGASVACRVPAAAREQGDGSRTHEKRLFELGNAGPKFMLCHVPTCLSLLNTGRSKQRTKGRTVYPWGTSAGAERENS